MTHHAAFAVGVTCRTGRHWQSQKVIVSRARTTLESERVRKRERFQGRLCAREVMAVHTNKCRYRSVGAVVATLLIVSMSLAGCSSGGNPSACAAGSVTAKGSSGLTAAKGVSSTTLPPSHDNDAGEGRIPDHTPDADIDANQRHQSCSRPK